MNQSSDPAIVLALIAVVSSTVVALFKLLNDNTKALGSLAEASNAIAEATKTGNEEAKQRNGHLGEQNIHIAELIVKQGKDLAALQASADKKIKR